MRRCGFFFDVFGLELPEYLHCKLFTDSLDSEECVGGKEMKEWKTRKPTCDEFSCDKNRCIPYQYVCDGVVDCFDQTDELRCAPCNTTASKGTLIHCGERKCMNDGHICDGSCKLSLYIIFFIIPLNAYPTDTCPYGEDERNCIRLSSTNGDLGKGTLEVYRASRKRWEPACVRHWDQSSALKVCSMLGYNTLNYSRVFNRVTNLTLYAAQDGGFNIRNSQQRKPTNILRDYTDCNDSSKMVAELICTSFECGKIRTKRRRLQQKRIVGGKESKPGLNYSFLVHNIFCISILPTGDWPFLAAILGGPEEIFYCAGVLIADQWILTASHCIGKCVIH